MFPPVAASYQTTVCPAAAVAVAVNVWIGEASHSVLFPPDTGADGAALMVSVTADRVNEEQVPAVALACA